MDFRPNSASEVIGTYGRSQANHAVEPTGLGPAQVKDWVYQTYQVRGRFKSFVRSGLHEYQRRGRNYLLTAVSPTTNCPDVHDPSPASSTDRRQIAAQLQYGIYLARVSASSSATTISIPAED